LIKVLTSAALAASLLMAGCGGGADGSDQGANAASLRALDAAAETQGANDNQRRHVLVASEFSADLTSQLFARAESEFAAYFPSKQATRSFDGWAYRYYPETGIYLAVIGSGVYALGGAFGSEVVRLGEITEFVSQQPTGQDRPLTAAILSQCPDSQGSQLPSFYQCMIGSLTGTQKFNAAKSCRLDINHSGVWTLSSDGMSVTVGPEFGLVYYYKSASMGLVTTSVKQPGTGFMAEIKLGPSRLSFAEGGAIDAEAKAQGSSNAVISCQLNVPK
jgi:hypothetical protein